MKRLYLLVTAIALLCAGCGKKPASRVAITMRRGVITPAEIHLRAGERTRLVITTEDVEHSFVATGLGLREPVQPGRPAEVDVTPKQHGSFAVECGMLCGPGHNKMKATIVVD